MMAKMRFPLAAGICWLMAMAAATTAPARPQQTPQPDVQPAQPKHDDGQAQPDDELARQQGHISDNYRHFEKVLLRMAELTEATDPRRAALLKKAVQLSGDELIGVQFERLIELLRNDQLARAIENQTDLDQDLQALLELLLSENRGKRIEAEKARIRSYLKRLNRLIQQQKDVQGRSEGSNSPRNLAGEQAQLAENTGKLAQDIKQNEEGTGKGKPAGEQNAKGEGQGKGQSEADQQPKQSAHGQGKSQSKGQGQRQQSQGKGQGQKQQGGQGQAEGQPQGQSEPQNQAPPQPQEPNQHPARQRLEAAQQRMREAEAKLREAQREGAVEKQEEAIRELQRAKAELEEILRQLREEEIMRMLAMLEARFRHMLQLQREVYDGTVQLGGVPEDQRSHSHQIEARRLSAKQTQILVECDKVLLLLREDGSAVAFPEAVAQMREDIQQVVLRLAQAKVGEITQAIETDIIAALEEMIEALKKAQQEKKSQPERSKPPKPGRPSEPALVDLMAEIKMIRALQMRVNRRTDRYSQLIQGEQADSPELVQALQRLAERQQRIYQVTRDLALGKNQ